MAAPFDPVLLGKLLDVPAIAITDGRAKKVTFDSVCRVAKALLFAENQGAAPDVFFVAKSVAFRKKEGGVPLIVPGWAPIAEIAARAAGGEASDAIAESIGARRADVENAMAFQHRWLGGAKPSRTKPVATKAVATKPTKMVIVDRAVTRAAASLPSPVDQVEAVIRSMGADPRRRPLARAALAKLRLASGAALPASLGCWLAFDTALAPPHRAGRLVARTFPQLVREHATSLSDLGLDLGKLPGDCYVLQDGDEQTPFLYAGTADADGEFSVLVLDAREQDVVLAAPGFDVWLATIHGLVASDAVGELPRAYGPLMREHARIDLGGKRTMRL